LGCAIHTDCFLKSPVNQLGAIAALQQSLHGRSEMSMEEAVRERKQARDKIAEYFNEKRSRHPEYRTELRDLLGYRWRTGLAVIELAVR
jgi:hypothetical protein